MTAPTILIVEDEALVCEVTAMEFEDAGWTVAAEARTLRPGLPVIYASGFSPDPVRRVDGAVFVRKPYLPTAIVAAAKDLLQAGT